MSKFWNLFQARSIDQARNFYEKLVEQFPNAGRYWKAYIEHELRAKNFDRVEQVCFYFLWINWILFFSYLTDVCLKFCILIYGSLMCIISERPRDICRITERKWPKPLTVPLTGLELILKLLRSTWITSNSWRTSKRWASMRKTRKSLLLGRYTKKHYPLLWQT